MTILIAGPLFFGLIATLLPTPSGRSRETANRVRCAMGLREIAKAIQLYAIQNDDWLPPSLATLADQTPGFDFNWPVCPSSRSRPASSPQQLITEQAGELTAPHRKHCTCIYAGAGLRLSDIDAETVLLYELLDDHDYGANIVFGDFHVEFLMQNPIRRTGPAAEVVAAHQRGVHPLRLQPATRPTTRGTP